MIPRAKPAERNYW